MARTDVKKARQAVWMPCPMEEYNDERHLVLPGVYQSLQYVSTKSMVNEYRNGQQVRESDTTIFTFEWLKKHWLGWENVGLVHEDGTVEDPAEFTEKNWLEIINNRGQAFVLWLQDASRQLAAAAQQQRDAERENFRESPPVPTEESGATL